MQRDTVFILTLLKSRGVCTKIFVGFGNLKDKYFATGIKKNATYKNFLQICFGNKQTVKIVRKITQNFTIQILVKLQNECIFVEKNVTI